MYGERPLLHVRLDRTLELMQMVENCSVAGEALSGSAYISAIRATTCMSARAGG